MEFEEQVQKCKSIAELKYLIFSQDRDFVVVGSRHIEYPKHKLYVSVDVVSSGWAPVQTVTRSAGLRRKVMELLEYSQEAIDLIC
jgi:hypothetical protein